MMNIEEKLESAIKRSFLQIFVISIFFGLFGYTLVFFVGNAHELSVQAILKHLLVFFCGTVFFSCASFLAICAFLVPYLLEDTLKRRLAARAKKSVAADEKEAGLEKKDFQAAASSEAPAEDVEAPAPEEVPNQNGQQGAENS